MSQPVHVHLWAAYGLPAPVAEYRFAEDIGRRWRMDYAWPEHKLFIEVQGGLFVRGRHNQGAAMLKEFEKLNEAAIRGYRALFVTPEQLASGMALDLVAKALGR